LQQTLIIGKCALIGAEAVKSIKPEFTLDNPFDYVMQDPRFKTEIVYEDWDGKKWVGKTLFDAYTEAGFDSVKNKGYLATDGKNKVYWFQKQNAEFFRAMEPYFQKINDHALFQSLYTPIKKIFPDIITGNYNIYHGINKNAKNQHFEVRNLWSAYAYERLGSKKISQSRLSMSSMLFC
jgi:hypothetical protein